MVLKWKTNPISIENRKMAQFFMPKHVIHTSSAAYSTGEEYDIPRPGGGVGGRVIYPYDKFNLDSAVRYSQV